MLKWHGFYFDFIDIVDFEHHFFFLDIKQSDHLFWHCGGTVWCIIRRFGFIFQLECRITQYLNVLLFNKNCQKICNFIIIVIIRKGFKIEAFSLVVFGCIINCIFGMM